VLRRLTVDDGQSLAVEDSGGQGPVVVFSHGLLFSRRMFEAQVAALSGRYRCIAYDHRGQGDSSMPPGDVIPLERCTEDAVALIERMKLGSVRWVGLSMGGMVGMRLAARRPDLISSLSLLNTSAGAEDPRALPRFRLLMLAARTLGPSWVMGQAMRSLFGRSFLADPARAALRERWRSELVALPRGITAACAGVFGRASALAELPSIRCPTLVIAGEEDVATRPACSEEIARAIPGARLELLRQTGHSSTIEEPRRVSDLLRAHLEG
jgi:pimeloyl-ACP methyl ester carboxylesterase